MSKNHQIFWKFTYLLPRCCGTAGFTCGGLLLNFCIISGVTGLNKSCVKPYNPSFHTLKSC